MNILVIGGGAAGYFAAIHHKARYPDHQVTIIEKSETGLSKVKISGGGRCNLTHACFDAKRLADYYPRGGKALIGPFQRFQPRDTMTWFQTRGVPLKIEADGRVFPVSNNSQSIIDALIDEAAKLAVGMWNQTAVSSIVKTPLGAFQVALNSGVSHTYDRIILTTGSSRAGYQLAQSLGHNIVDPIPSLFTVKIDDPELHALAGVSVADAQVTLHGDKTWKQRGPVLVTHWGLSGPAIIRLSAWAAREFSTHNYQLPMTVQWLPEYSELDIESAISAAQSSSKKWVSSHSLFPEISGRLWAYLVQKSVKNGAIPWNEMSKKQSRQLIECLLRDRYQISGKGVFKEEFVTCGGIPLNEVNFKTMESRVCPGLFFAGEILDIDGITGGFNFQNAWTTGVIAGESANSSSL